MTPGKKFKILRETLVDMVEQSYKEVNIDMFPRQVLKRSFEKCGLNPYIGNSLLIENLNKMEES